MTHKPEHDQHAGLEAYFAAARADLPEPTGDLIARIEAQALAQQIENAPVAERGSFLAGLVRALGGWPAMAGLAAAACAGVWIGFAPPDAMLALIDGDSGFGALDPVSGYDFALVEG